MTISIIAAMAENRIIGKANSLPWHLPADLKHFKRLTTGKPVVMGRKTFESMSGPLRNRRNIVVTRNQEFTGEGAEVAHSLEEALERAAGEPEVMIAGGAEIYAQAIPVADRMYLTVIHQEFSGDTTFPAYDEQEWIEREREDHRSDGHPYSFSFIRYERLSNHKFPTGNNLNS